jgi:hypothetical protein
VSRHQRIGLVDLLGTRERLCHVGRHVDSHRGPSHFPAEGAGQRHHGEHVVLALQHRDTGGQLFKDLAPSTCDEQVLRVEVELRERRAQAGELADVPVLLEQHLRHQVFVDHAIHLAVRQAGDEYRFCSGDELGQHGD